MSTRAIVNLKSGGVSSPTLVTVYNHSDGYPSGLGRDLKTIAARYEIVNGISFNKSGLLQANGIECFAAALIKDLKQGAGGIYIYPLDSKPSDVEYFYTIYQKNNKIVVEGTDYKGKKIKEDEYNQ